MLINRIKSIVGALRKPKFSLTLATMDSIIHCFGISTEDMGNRFVNWMEKSEYTATGERFDIGRTTLIALAKKKDILLRVVLQQKTVMVMVL